MYRYIKRFLDILFSLLLLPILLILIIAAAIMIEVDDRGPIFYVGERLGRNGRVFKMFKLRSMKVNAPDIRLEDGSTFNGENDPRVTKIGRILRKTSLDEVPQILNILKGDMSFIGPRPDLPEHLKLYEGNESRKLEVRPGITGYSQAYFRNSIPWKERIKNDIFYIDHISFILDIKITLKTVEGVIKRDNVYVKRKGVSGREF